MSARPSAVPGARVPHLRGARALFTARQGGVSAPPFDSLNLARHVGDEPVDVEQNRARVSRTLGLPLVFVEQVHSDRVHVLRADDPAAGHGHGAQDGPVTADAIVTDRSDLALAIMVADCLPVLFSDPEAGVVAAAHAGRAGLLGGILERTLEAMAALGADPARTAAAIGPGICGACYEVPEAMREEAAAQLPETWACTRGGTPALDLRAGAVAVLRAQGLEPAAIAAEQPCTREDETLFSYRGARRTGRFAGVIAREGSTADRGDRGDVES